MGRKPTVGPFSSPIRFLVAISSAHRRLTIQIPSTAATGCRLGCYSPARVDFSWKPRTQLFKSVDFSWKPRTPSNRHLQDHRHPHHFHHHYLSMMRGGLSSRSRRSPHSDDAGNLGHLPSSTDAGRGGAAGSPPRSQHSPVVVAPSSSTSTASLPPGLLCSMVNIPAEAFDSESDTQTMTDPNDDY
jgi:hypothetical protein